MESRSRLRRDTLQPTQDGSDPFSSNDSFPDNQRLEELLEPVPGSSRSGALGNAGMGAAYTTGCATTTEEQYELDLQEALRQSMEFKKEREPSASKAVSDDEECSDEFDGDERALPSFCRQQCMSDQLVRERLQLIEIPLSALPCQTSSMASLGTAGSPDIFDDSIDDEVFAPNAASTAYECPAGKSSQDRAFRNVLCVTH